MSAETRAAAAGPPPQAIAVQLSVAFELSRAVHVACELGVPDLLGTGARTFGEIAEATGTEPDRMRRLLRVLAAAGVVKDLATGQFALTPVGDCLRSGVPHSVRAILRFQGSSVWQAFESLADCVRTGKHAFELRYDLPSPFAYLAQHPHEAAVFNDAMSGFSTSMGAAVARSYDFAGVGHIVDIAGGHGRMLAALLKPHPHLRGTLLDMPDVVEAAQPILAGEGVADRCEVLGGDMLASVPPGGDVYILSHIIHDWDDATAGQLLQTCRRAMGSGARLLIVDRVLPELAEPDPATLRDALLDLTMMVFTGGRERTVSEFEALLGTAGLRLERVISLPIPDKLIEAAPV